MHRPAAADARAAMVIFFLTVSCWLLLMNKTLAANGRSEQRVLPAAWTTTLTDIYSWQKLTRTWSRPVCIMYTMCVDDHI